jgi:hypothetical protein
MVVNKFEQKLLSQIEEINEGIAWSVIKFLMKPLVRREFRKLGEDPEIKASLESLEFNTNELKRALENGEVTDPRLAKLIQDL